MATFTDIGPARTYAAINGITFDTQDDYCEACRAYHVGIDHEDAVPIQCGSVSLQGFDVVLECVRAPHATDSHRNLMGTTWPLKVAS